MSSAKQNTTPSAQAGDNHVELAIGGMTCASCAARIEKKLNRLDGVTATVNYATEKAKVSFTCPSPRRPRPTTGSQRRLRPTSTSAACSSGCSSPPS
jgi:cation transport ATPase